MKYINKIIKNNNSNSSRQIQNNLIWKQKIKLKKYSKLRITIKKNMKIFHKGDKKHT